MYFDLFSIFYDNGHFAFSIFHMWFKKSFPYRALILIDINDYGFEGEVWMSVFWSKTFRVFKRK